VVNLIKTAEYAIQQNNSIDLFEEYFQEVRVCFVMLCAHM
jgi:hypothetical protein